MRTAIVFALLASALPAVAQSPSPSVSQTPVNPQMATAGAITPTTAAGPPSSLLDSLIGKKQIVGLTKQDGTRYLCHFNSGDHGVYIVQEFHFAGPPHVSTQKALASQGAPIPHYKTVTIGSGRARQRVRVLTGYTPARAANGRRTQIKTDTTIPDEQAIRLLLAGVAGSNHAPREIEAGRDMITPSQIKFLQLLSPPTVSATTKALPTPTTERVAAPTVAPAAGSRALPTTGSAVAAPSSSAWTLTTLWPTNAASSVNGAASHHARTRRRKQSG